MLCLSHPSGAENTFHLPDPPTLAQQPSYTVECQLFTFGMAWMTGRYPASLECTGLHISSLGKDLNPKSKIYFLPNVYHLQHHKAEESLTWTIESRYLISGKQKHTLRSPFPVGVGVCFSAFMLYLNIVVSSEDLKYSLKRNEAEKRDREGHPSHCVTFTILPAKNNPLVKSLCTIVRSANVRHVFLTLTLMRCLGFRT